MRPNSSSAILTSLILHAFVAAVIFVTTIYVARSDKVAPAIIELVAGPGDDMNALEAPALGTTSEPIKVPIPQVELPPEPAADPTPADLTPAAPEPPVREVVVPKAEPMKTPPAKTPPKAKSEIPITKQVKQSEKISYQQYLKKNPIRKQSAASTVRNNSKVPKIDTQGIRDGVKQGSTASQKGAGGPALTREEADQLAVYQSFLKQELEKAHEPPPGVSDRLETYVTFDVTASGAILNPRISKSSGNREFDQSVLEAFRKMRSIGPTPTRRPYSWGLTFKMRDDG